MLPRCSAISPTIPRQLATSFSAPSLPCFAQKISRRRFASPTPLPSAWAPAHGQKTKVSRISSSTASTRAWCSSTEWLYLIRVFPSGERNGQASGANWEFTEFASSQTSKLFGISDRIGRHYSVRWSGINCPCDFAQRLPRDFLRSFRIVHRNRNAIYKSGQCQTPAVSRAHVSREAFSVEHQVFVQSVVGTNCAGLGKHMARRC